MIINKINIENFRCIRSIELQVSSINTIIGMNNAGKSTVMAAIAKFFSKTPLKESDFYDKTKKVRIELEFKSVSENDINLIDETNRSRIAELINNNSIRLIRYFKLNEKVEDYYRYKTVPIDDNLDTELLYQQCKDSGKKLPDFLREIYPGFSDQFSSCTSKQKLEEAIANIISSLDNSKLKEKEACLTSGIEASIRPMLPEVIYIPAIKDANDEMKIKEASAFGKLIRRLVETISSNEQIKSIEEALKELKKLTNIINGQDNRINEVKKLEENITTNLVDVFPKVKLELKIELPELKEIFGKSEIFIDDGIATSIENKGDGLKRALIFALLRTYANAMNKDAACSLLILFEEPELFLHPAAQRILFSALDKISVSDQIFITTHSPLFFSAKENVQFFKIIKKEVPESIPFSQVLALDPQDVSSNEIKRLLCYENNEVALFSSRVFLVEGESDTIVYKYFAKKLNNYWDFDELNIPIIRINGKGNIKKYRKFFNAFNVNVYSAFDLDILCHGFEHLETSDEIKRVRNDLLADVDSILRSEMAEIEIVGKNKEKIQKHIESNSFKEKYQAFKDEINTLTVGGSVSQSLIDKAICLFEKEEELLRISVLRREINGLENKNKLLALLNKENILVLSKGDIENYYPHSSSGKIKSAEQLLASQCTAEAIKKNSCVYDIDGKEQNELEYFFKNLFQSLASA